MDEQLVTIYRAPNAIQAHLLKQLFAEHDIPCRVVGDSIINVESLDSPVLVLVPVKHQKLAAFMADAFDRNVVQVPHDRTAPVCGTHQWDQWPACQRCGTKRMTWCGFCGTIGSNFAMADPTGWEESGEILLLCSICDEPFTPQFHRRCASCGRRFADGVDGPAVSDESQHDVWRSVIGATLVLAAFCCFAWWMLRW